MNAPLTAHVALSEPEVEGVVLGSIFTFPEVMPALGSSFNVDWFTDPAARAFAEAVHDLHRNGHRVSAATVISAVSPAVEVDGLTRAQFVARCMTLAVPLAMLSGSLAVLKDRWERRILSREAAQLARCAVAIDVDPHAAASTTLGALDAVIAARGEQVSGTLAESTDEMFAEHSEAKDRELVTTGLRSLDDALNGYAPGSLYVVAARPGMGKSAFMCSSGRKTAAAGFGVACFSLEMGREEIAARCLADEMATSPHSPGFGAIKRGVYGSDDLDAMIEARSRFDGLPFHIDASPKLSMLEIGARSRAIKSKFEANGRKLSVVFVDHMGLVEPSDRYAGNKVAETGEVSRAGKVLAKQLDVCVVLLCQLSRKVEERDDKRPTLSDLRWSGDIEQDADVCAFLYREEYYLRADPKADPDQLAEARNRLEFLIRKNRNGPADDVPLWCSIAHSAIRDEGRGY